MLSWGLPIIFFGSFENSINYIIFPISLLILLFTSKKKFKNDNIGYYLSCFIIGTFYGTFKLSPFFNYSNKFNILDSFGLSFYGSNIIGYWISFLSFIILYLLYKLECKKSIMKEFGNDEKRIIRESKINSIIGKWWN